MKNYLGTIALIVLILGGGFVYSSVQEGNNFSACVKNVTVKNCEDKGMEYVTHDNIVSMDSFYGSETYECVENPINENKNFMDNYHEYDFLKSEIEVCQK